MKIAMKQAALLLLWMAVTSLIVSAQTTEPPQSPSAAPQDPSAPSPHQQTAPGQTPPAQQMPPQAPTSPTSPPQTAPETPSPQTPPAQQQSPGTPPSATTPPAPPYKAKFPGDPARSESESQALGYMRVVLRAEQLYKKRHDKYAESLADLAGTGSFTRRMAKSTERGDYTVGFRPRKDGFVLVMTPKQLDAEHRSFYAEEDAIIHADDQKPADAASPRIK